MKRTKSKRGGRLGSSSVRRDAARAKPPAPRSPVSGRRRRIFALLALALPVVLLALLEVCLRLAGYGYDAAFFKTERDASGREFLVNNDSFTFRFFPPELARWPGAFRLDAHKPPDVQRIFVFGESAAMGDPQPSVGPAHILEVLLREKYPEQKFEVVNLGITAINSHVILPIARDVATRGQGDIWLVYMGNNEMVGPFGAASVFGARGAPLIAVRLNLLLQQTRLGQLAVSWFRGLRGDSAGPAWGGMNMFLENKLPPDDPRREAVYRNFKRNLQDMVQAGLQSGSGVALCTVSVNLRDCPPFASQIAAGSHPSEAERFHALFADGVRLQTNGQSNLAAEVFARAAGIEPDFAELSFRYAQCLEGTTNETLMRQYLQKACDADALPFRADSRINEVIRTVAREEQNGRLVLCDAERALAAAAPGGISGDESFFEHVHFNFDGNYRIAVAWAESVARLLPAGIRQSATAGWASQAECERAIGLSDWNRAQVVSSVVARMAMAPLAQQMNNAARMQKLQRQIQRIAERQRVADAVSGAHAAFASALAKAPGDVELRRNYGGFLEAIGDRPRALAEYSKILDQLPHDFDSAIKRGQLLRELGRPGEAQPLLRQLADRRPTLPEPWLQLGLALWDDSKYAAALECFDIVGKMYPADARCLVYRARALSKLNRRARAMELYRKAITLDPDNWQAHLELAEELVVANKADEAIREYLEAVRLNGRHPMMRVNLGVMLVRQNRLDEAIQQFEAALQLDPDNRTAHDYLLQVRQWRDQAGN